jgi:hypothetical protein
MNWKLLLPLPIAAFLAGRSFEPPRLSPPIPVLRDAACDYPSALDAYLLAYAYARESPGAARQLLRAAERARRGCVADTSVLRERIRLLRASLP